MKKYLILIVIVLLSIGIIVFFDVTDRIKIGLYGIGGYDEKDYDINNEQIDNIQVNVNLKEYVGDKIVLYRCDEYAQIYIKRIEYRANSYRFYIVCEGRGGFDSGKMLSIEEFNGAKTEINGLDFNIELVGIDSIVDNQQNYYLDLVPNEEVSMEIISQLEEVEFEIDGANLVVYERK